ncbi:MAG: MYXO-CTERM sorting domain-containing protein [Planctomycetota bacterium]
MKTLLPTLALTAAAAFVAAPAHAGSAHYLTGHGGLATSHTIVSGDVTITATASAYNPGKQETHSAHVGQYRYGMGVTNGVYKNKWGRTRSTDGSHTVDGKGWKDTLWLSFDKPFEVLGAVFSYVDGNDGVNVVDGDGGLLGSYGLGSLRNKWGIAHLDLSELEYTGTKIGFTARDSNDDWKVKAVKGEPGHTEAVPTPSAAAAGLLGLAALSARRRRREEETAAE